MKNPKVVGSVGSGKTSLLNGLVGELNKQRGYVNVNGQISYVTQEAWIQNETVKQNIIFGKYFDEALYHDCIKACALDIDLNLLPAGDKTELGEKVN